MRRLDRGFTLIELMIATTIIGILAAVVIPAFVGTACGCSKKSEASLQLNKIARAAKAYYQEHGTWPPARTIRTPPIDCCTQNVDGKRRCAPRATDWNAPGWKQLDFQIDEPFNFQYEYTPSETGFSARAIGNLDCDADSITYFLFGSEHQETTTQLMTRITEPSPNTD